MSTPPEPARIHLLPAKESPIVIVIRRKPSKVFHILKWNTRKDTIESGSWFSGVLHPFKSDVSYDGKWMVYLALGGDGKTWSGICTPPWLKTSSDWDFCGLCWGGGYWSSRNRLLLFGAPSWRNTKGDRQYPFKIGPFTPKRVPVFGEILFSRMERDGWRRAGKPWSEWIHRPTAKHPTLRATYKGSSKYGDTFRFSIDEYAALLDSDVTWATWDSDGNLVFAQRGVLFKYDIEDIASGRPAFEHDLEYLRNGDA